MFTCKAFSVSLTDMVLALKNHAATKEPTPHAD